MQNSAWAALLRHIPSEVHHNLMLVTVSGTEMCIQNILRIDHEFVAFKGRLAGSQDAGRLFFVTFDQIDYFGFQQPVKDTDFHELFDGLKMPNPVATPRAAPVAAAEPEPEPEPEPELAPEPPVAQEEPPAPETQAEPVAPPPAPVVKSAVLERFRARKPISGVRPSIRP
jgi:hypothetical protein